MTGTCAKNMHFCMAVQAHILYGQNKSDLENSPIHFALGISGAM